MKAALAPGSWLSQRVSSRPVTQVRADGTGRRGTGTGASCGKTTLQPKDAACEIFLEFLLLRAVWVTQQLNFIGFLPPISLSSRYQKHNLQVTSWRLLMPEAQRRSPWDSHVCPLPSTLSCREVSPDLTVQSSEPQSLPPGNPTGCDLSRRHFLSLPDTLTFHALATAQLYRDSPSLWMTKAAIHLPPLLQHSGKALHWV